MSSTLRQQLEEANKRIVLLERDNETLAAYVETAKNAEQLQIQLTEYTKRLTSSESARDAYLNQLTACRLEMQQLHEVLDALPGSIPIRAEGGYNDRSVLTRLAAWLGSTK